MSIGEGMSLPVQINDQFFTEASGKKQWNNKIVEELQKHADFEIPASLESELVLELIKTVSKSGVPNVHLNITQWKEAHEQEMPELRKMVQTSGGRIRSEMGQRTTFIDCEGVADLTHGMQKLSIQEKPKDAIELSDEKKAKKALTKFLRNLTLLHQQGRASDELIQKSQQEAFALFSACITKNGIGAMIEMEKNQADTNLAGPLSKLLFDCKNDISKVKGFFGEACKKFLESAKNLSFGGVFLRKEEGMFPNNYPLSDQQLREIVNGCPNLQNIHFENRTITDETLKILAKLPHLRNITFAACTITAESFPEFPSIKTLKLVGSKVSDGALQTLSSPTLESIWIESDMRHEVTFPKLPHLKRLKTRESFQSLKTLAKLLAGKKELTTLDLSDSNLQTIPNLEQLQKLQELNVRNCPLNPDTFQKIGNLKNLKFLQVSWPLHYALTILLNNQFTLNDYLAALENFANKDTIQALWLEDFPKEKIPELMKWFPNLKYLKCTNNYKHTLYFNELFDNEQRIKKPSATSR